MKHEIYLAGPMFDDPARSHPIFHAVSARLRAAGHVVYSPAEFKYTEIVFPPRKGFAEYCAFICNRATLIVVLPGWEDSKGCKTELALADSCGIGIVEWKDIQHQFPVIA